MTTDEMIAVLEAYKEGKTIEYRNKVNGEWVTLPFSPVWDFGLFDYRVKPEPHYRPFESAEEVMEAIKEHGGYIKEKAYKKGFYIVQATSDGEIKVASHNWLKYTEAFALFVFYDGTPFGKLEE